MLATTDIDDLTARLARFRLPLNSEAQAQDAIADLLKRQGVPFEREYAFSARERIDFLVGCFGIEVKVSSGSRRSILRQLERYAAHDISGLILMSRTAWPNLDEVGGKPFRSIALSGAWLG